MNPEVQQLRQLIKDHESKQKKKRKRNTKATNSLTKAICDYLRLNGHYAARVNGGGFYREDLGKYIKSGSTDGLPDIISIVHGQFIGIEIKTGRDRQSEAQKVQEERITQAGGLYWIVKSFDDFMRQWEQR